MRAAQLVLAVVATVFAGACSSSDGPPTGPTVDNAVGPAGGTLSAAGGRVTLAFPSGAVSTNTTITVEVASSVPASAGLVPGSAYRFSPEGITFQQPVTLTVRYDPAALPAGVSDTSLALYKVVDGAWQPAGVSLRDTAAHTVRAAIQGFSTYGVLGRPPVLADSMMIGPAGGTMTAGGGTVTIVFPQGAFNQNTIVSVRATTAIPASPDVVAATAFVLEPATGTLLRPVLLSYNYAPAGLPAGALEHELGLHHATADAWVLDTGTVVDTVLNTVTVAVNALGTHAILRRAGAHDAATVAYVVDTIPAGRPQYFTAPAPAVLYACGRGAAAGTPRVMLHTARAVAGGAVAVPCSAHFGRSPGVGGSFAGPLHITAPAGFAMEGMSVSGATVIDVGGFLLLRANTFAGLTTTNILEPAAAARGATSAARAPSLACGSGATVAANTFAAGMDMNLNANVQGDCTFELSENGGPRLAFAGSGSLGGSSVLRYRANPVAGLGIDTRLKASALVSVEGHGSLNALNTTLHMQDTPTLAVTNNLVAEAAVTLDGVGSATLRLESNNIQNGNLTVSVADLDLHGIGGTFGTMATHLLTDNGITPQFHWNQDGGTFGPFSINAPLGAAGRDKPCDLTVGGAVFNGEVTGEFECHATIALSQDIKLNAGAALTVHSSVLDLAATDFDANAAVSIRAYGVEAELNATLQNGHFRKGADILGDVGIAFAVKVVDFDIDEHGLHISQGGGAPSPRFAAAGAPITRSPSAAGDSVIVRGMRTAAGFVGNAVEVINVQVPILIDSVQLHTSGYGVLITDVTTPVRVRNSHFYGNGIGIERATGTVLLEHNTVEVTSGPGIVLTDNGPTTIHGSRIVADGFGATGLTGTNTAVTLDADTIVANGAFGVVLNQAGESRIQGTQIAVGGAGGIGLMLADAAQNSDVAQVLNSEITVAGDGGVGLFLRNAGQPLLQDDRIIVSSQGTAIVAFGTSPTVTNSTLNTPVNAFANLDGGRAVLTGNTITGSVDVGSFMRLTGNTFISGSVFDYGWLLNDPMQNSGLDPETDIWSPIDFDGNLCRDYPPYGNVKENGICAEDGIPMPADPGPTAALRTRARVTR